MRIHSHLPLRRSSFAAAILLAASTVHADAATFDLFRAGTTDLLGTFEAPASGGLLTAASISVKGGVFDVLGLGSMAPVFDAVEMDVDGNGGVFGTLFNSVAFLTTDIAANPVSCGIGECVFSFEGSSGPVPGQWYVDYIGVGGAAALAFGHYDVAASTPAPVPLPMTAVLLIGAGALLFAMRRAGGRTQTVAS